LEQVFGELAAVRARGRIRRREAAVGHRVSRMRIDRVEHAEHELDHALRRFVQEPGQERRAAVAA
jgi:hypothetical protein